MRNRATRLVALWICVLSPACASRDPRPGPPQPLAEPLRVLILGDSISMGYTPHVRRMLAGRAAVFRPMSADGSKQVNCQGTNHGVEHVGEWLAIDGGGFDVIHFNFGLHDLKRVDPATGKNSNEASDPHQAPPEGYEAQLRAIVRMLEASGARLVFATTTPVPPGSRPYRAPEDARTYNRIARRVMAEAGIPIDDLYAFAEPILADIQKPANVHFTPAGSEALARQVADAILAVAGLAERS